MKDTDRNYFSLADVDGRTLDGLRLDPTDDGHEARAFDDVLKLSHATNITARRLWVRGGSENAIDMNRECAHVTISDSRLLGGDQCAVVIKGGSHAIRLARIDIIPGGSKYDIELGGWSDQSLRRTTGVELIEVNRFDGAPVLVVVGHADRPRILGGNVRVLFWRSLALKTFWLIRFLAGGPTVWRKWKEARN